MNCLGTDTSGNKQKEIVLLESDEENENKNSKEHTSPKSVNEMDISKAEDSESSVEIEESKPKRR